MKRFNETYRELLRQDTPEAPEDVWTHLSSQLDKDAIHKQQTSEEKELIDEVWTNLENQLDIDEVWGNISNQLDIEDAKPRENRFRYRMAAATVLLLLGAAGLMNYFSSGIQTKQVAKLKPITQVDSLMEATLTEPHQVSQSKQAELHNQDQKSNTASSNTTRERGTTAPAHKPFQQKSLEINSNTQRANRTTQPSSKAGSEQQKIGADKNKQQLAFNEYEIPVSHLNTTIDHDSYLVGKKALIVPQLEYKPNLDLVLPEQELMDSYSTPNLDNGYTSAQIDELLATATTHSRWSTGLVTALKNTYLLNDETMDGFSPSGMNESKVTLLPDIGLNVQYALSQRYILNTNVFFTSSAKQNYNTYKHGEYVSKALQLDYLAGEFTIKHNAKNSVFNSDKMIRRNVAGIYVAALHSASEKLLREQKDISSKYTALDYGLVLGQEIEFVSHGPVKISTGVTIKYGLPNVYAGDSTLPGNLNQTHNASFEFRVGIAYQWKTKTALNQYLSFIGGK